jgi:hypothetical protein
VAARPLGIPHDLARLWHDLCGSHARYDVLHLSSDRGDLLDLLAWPSSAQITFELLMGGAQAEADDDVRDPTEERRHPDPDDQ